jgi:alkylation response protein AidB-like acyl-CoA dehydrogenase
MNSPAAIDLAATARQLATKLNAFSTFKEKWNSAAGLFFAGITLPIPGMTTRLSAADTASVMHALGENSSDGGFNFSIAAHLFAAIIPLGGYGKNPVHLAALEKAGNGSVFANAMTESSSGSDAFKMKTTATRKGNEYIISGSKTFVTNGPIADFFIVYAMTDSAKGFFGGVTCFLLDKSKHKIGIGTSIEKNALRNSPMCELYFENCVVGEEYIIGTEGGGAMIFMESMDWERACIAAMHAGTISRICSEASQYVKTRVRAGKPLSKFQAVQFKIADIAVLAETSRLMSEYAAAKLDAKSGTIAAAQAKIMASESLMQAATLAATVMGGNGITTASGLTDLLADAQASLIYSGPNDVLRELIASRL